MYRVLLWIVIPLVILFLPLTTSASDQVVIIHELPLPLNLKYYQKKEQVPFSTDLQFNYTKGTTKSIYIGFTSIYRF